MLRVLQIHVLETLNSRSAGVGALCVRCGRTKRSEVVRAPLFEQVALEPKSRHWPVVGVVLLSLPFRNSHRRRRKALPPPERQRPRLGRGGSGRGRRLGGEARGEAPRSIMSALAAGGPLTLVMQIVNGHSERSPRTA